MESKEMSIDIEEFEKMPDKVRKIYEAVGELAREGRDVTTLRVSEISAKAGIGKGTTYEYFTSKEELISKAVFYSMYTNIKTILLIMYGAGSFKEKFYNIRIEKERLEIAKAYGKAYGNPLYEDIKSKLSGVNPKFL